MNGIDFITELIWSLGKKLFDEKEYVSKRKIKVGLLDIDEIEKTHNFSIIESYLIEDQSSVVYIGSPHLSYWLETDSSRLGRLLTNTKKLSISVVYYNNYSNKEYIGKLLELEKTFPGRLVFATIEKEVDLSYIIYDFIHLKKRYTRALIGYQNIAYENRPFIEMVFRKDKQNIFVDSILDYHNTLI